LRRVLRGGPASTYQGASTRLRPLPKPLLALALVLAATAPGAPTLQSATADHQAGAVTVAFTAPPASDGGAPITGYRVRCRELPEIAPAVATSSPVIFTGLPRGRDLTFEVLAVNAVGPGPASAASQPVRLGKGGVTNTPP
jgi:hypothetical protein